MFRAYGPGPSLWESVLPDQLLALPEELARVDKLLDDPAFFEPFRPYFHPRVGRQSVPAETFLRLMYLKYRPRLGYESLCREVADSIGWQRFCRLPLFGRVPDHSTLKKTAKRCGPTAVETLNEAPLKKAAENKVLKTNRLRADTTCVPAVLESRARQYTLPYRDVVRAKIVLTAAAGMGNDEIAARLDTRREVVSKWRKRFFEQGLGGLEERPRGGRPPVVSP